MVHELPVDSVKDRLEVVSLPRVLAERYQEKLK